MKSQKLLPHVMDLGWMRDSVEDPGAAILFLEYILPLPNLSFSRLDFSSTIGSGIEADFLESAKLELGNAVAGSGTGDDLVEGRDHFPESGKLELGNADDLVEGRGDNSSTSSPSLSSCIEFSP